MRLKVVGTGSSGNCYVLEDAGEYLILDAGVNPKGILRAINYQTDKVLGCLVTHEHGDHACAVPALSKYGIQCYGTPGTKRAVPEINSNAESGRLRYLGKFVIKEIPVNHDANEPCGFLILNTNTNERMLYVTDTYYLMNRFPKINYWLIECNYCEELLTADTHPALIKRLRTSHMSLDSLCRLFEANDLHDCRQIILCHSSSERADPFEMTGKIHSLTHRPTIMARAGITIDLNLDPF